MLSGFVIAKAYESRLMTAMTFTGFVKVRFIRLYPMIVIGVLLGALIFGVRLLLTHSAGPMQLLIASLSALAVLPTTILFPFRAGMLYPLNGPEWSLFFELAVNLIYAQLVRGLTDARLILLCALAAFGLGSLALCNGGIDVGWQVNGFSLGLIRVCFPFFLGVLLYRFRPSFRLNWILGPLLGVLSASILFMTSPSGNWLFDVVAVALIFPLIIVLGAACPENASISRAWFFWGNYPIPSILRISRSSAWLGA